MRIVRPLVVLAALLAAIALPSVALADCPGADTATPVSAEGKAATLCLVNVERAAQGLPALSENARLDAASDAYAARMVAESFFAHESPDGGTLMERLHAAGWEPDGAWTAGENIAWGSGDRATPRAIVAAWMNSKGHRENILRAAFAQIGLGIAAGAPQANVPEAATYVTDFGSATDDAPALDDTPAPPAAPAAPAHRPAKKRAAARCAISARKAAKAARGKAARRGRCARR